MNIKNVPVTQNKKINVRNAINTIFVMLFLINIIQTISAISLQKATWVIVVHAAIAVFSINIIVFSEYHHSQKGKKTETVQRKEREKTTAPSYKEFIYAQPSPNTQKPVRVIIEKDKPVQPGLYVNPFEHNSY